MEYNSQRSDLKFSEYGRYVQKLIDYAVALPDKEQRTKIAHSIVNVMGQLNPQMRDMGDFKHKLWDHIFIMSDFKLDCDAPYPMPSPEEIKVKPQRIAYPSYKVPYRHYGNNILKMIDEAKKLDNGEIKDTMIVLIANYMKHSYVNWNRDNVNDETIFEQLYDLSEGKLRVKENTRLAFVKEPVHQPHFSDRKKKKKKRKR